MKIRTWAVGIMAAVSLGMVLSSAQADSPVKPFLNSQTSLVIHADLSNINVDAINDWMKKMLADSNLPADKQEKINQDDAKNAEHAKEWLAKFQKAGGKDVYLVIQFSGMFQGQLGEVVAPLPAGNNGAELAKVFDPNPTPADAGDPNDPQSAMRPTTAIIDNAVVFAPAPMIEKLKTDMGTEPRPELIDALAAGDHATVDIALVPSNLRNSPLSMLLQSMQRRTAGTRPEPLFHDPAWDNVTWVSTSMTPPPAESAGVTIQCKDAAGAQAVVDLLNKRIDDWKSNPQNPQEMEPADIEKLSKAIKPTISGTQVVIALDKTALDEVVFPIMVKAAAKRAAHAQPPSDQGMDNGNGNMQVPAPAPGGGM